jgi:DNA polymerase-3 subunit epsilon
MQPTYNTGDMLVVDTDMKILSRIKLDQQVPCVLFSEVSGNTIPLVILDLETTGLEADKEGITEVGLVRCTYDITLNRIVSIDAKLSLYNDPGVFISEFITNLTGITAEMVEGKNVEFIDIIEFFKDDPIVIAHNASFDRPFFEKKFPQLNNLRWVCSKTNFDWRERLGFESDKLEFLNYKSGSFYEGHRAEVDCFALLNLLILHPAALFDIFKSKNLVKHDIHVLRSAFSTKDALREAGCRWEADEKTHYGKHWWIKGVKGKDLDSKILELQGISPEATIAIVSFNAREAFK